MAIVICRRPAGTGLTPEEAAMLEEAEKLPQVFDDDCPKLTDEELAEFYPVNFTTWEERDRAMREAEPAKAGVMEAAAQG